MQIKLPPVTKNYPVFLEISCSDSCLTISNSVISPFFKFLSLYVDFFILLCSSASNPCEENDGRGPCSHLCLINYNRTTSCTCPHLMKLSANKQSCFGEQERLSHFYFYFLHSLCVVQVKCRWLLLVWLPSLFLFNIDRLLMQLHLQLTFWLFHYLNSPEKVPPVCTPLRNPWCWHWQSLHECNDGTDSARHRRCHSGRLWCSGGKNLLGRHQKSNHQTGVHQWYPAGDHHFFRWGQTVFQAVC